MPVTSTIPSPLLATPRVIVNGFSANGQTTILMNPGPSSLGAFKSTLSGALTANTLATMLTISGPGVLSFLGISTVDATARTLRLQLTLDGTVAFDATSASTSTSNYGFAAVGAFQAYSATVASGMYADELPFNASMVVKIASSLSETDKVYWHVAYRTV